MPRKKESINLPNSIRESLLRLSQLDENHPLVAAYRRFITDTPCPKNAEDVFCRFRPEKDAEPDIKKQFDDALVEFLAKIEDAVEEAEEANLVPKVSNEPALAHV